MLQNFISAKSDNCRGGLKDFLGEGILFYFLSELLRKEVYTHKKMHKIQQKIQEEELRRVEDQERDQAAAGVAEEGDRAEEKRESL